MALRIFIGAPGASLGRLIVPFLGKILGVNTFLVGDILMDNYVEGGIEYARWGELIS